VAARRDAAEAAALDAVLAPLYTFLGIEPNPIPVKWLLHRAGRIGPALRLPLLPLSGAHQVSAEAEWARLGATGLD